LRSFRSISLHSFVWETGPRRYNTIVSRHAGCESPNPASCHAQLLPQFFHVVRVIGCRCTGLNLKGDTIQSDTGP
jgi:hypothetical protein